MPRTTRRDFAKAVTAAALFAVDAHADTPPPAQAELVRTEFGQFLAGEELERIRKDFADSAPFLQKFRDVELKNSDEPDFTFRALTKR